MQFSRFTPTLAALIPLGTGLRSADGSLSFTVTQDSTNSAWSSAQNGYVLGAGIASVSVPIQAIVPGSAGNVQAGVITQLASAIPGIDTVINAAPLTAGLDAESDAALRSRFSAYLATRSRGTPLAIGNAVLSVRQGLDYTLQENMSPGGVSQIGCFVLTVDDGSGTPSSSLLASVANAVEATRPIGALYTIQPPTLLTANISLTVTTPANANHAIIVGNVANALTNAITALTIGVPVPWSRITQLAYAADPNVTNVTNVLLNGTTADLVPSASGLIRPGTIAVS